MPCQWNKRDNETQKTRIARAVPLGHDKRHRLITTVTCPFNQVSPQVSQPSWNLSMRQTKTKDGSKMRPPPLEMAIGRAVHVQISACAHHRERWDCVDTTTFLDVHSTVKLHFTVKLVACGKRCLVTNVHTKAHALSYMKGKHTHTFHVSKLYWGNCTVICGRTLTFCVFATIIHEGRCGTGLAGNARTCKPVQEHAKTRK